ncbi:MAG TPA: histidine kinase dimerization/phosphoacceptor domain -containing protein [Chitinophagales bacterium]|nr:histidine kinase dimerization/phosphoacceptor domain -containing protein [Chitinophagales bacterium]
MTLPKIYTWLLLMFAIVSAHAQTVEELRGQLISVKSDSAKARLSGVLAYKLAFTDTAEALRLTGEEIRLAPAGDSLVLLAEAYRTRGLIRAIQNRLPEAMDQYSRSLDYAKRANNKYYEAACKSLIAGMYQDNADYENALKYYLDGLKAAEQSGDKRTIGACCNNIATVYGAAGREPQLCLKYYAQAMQQATAINNLAFAGLIATNMAGEYMRAARKDSAEVMMSAALDFANRSGTRAYEYAVTLTGVGELYAQMDKPAEAQQMLLQAIALFDSLKRPINVLNPIMALCNLYLKQNKTAEAEVLGKRLLHDAQFYNARVFIREGYKILSEVARKKKKYEQSLEYFTQYSAWNDSVFNDDQQKSIANVQARAELLQRELEVQYQTTQKTQELQILKLNNRYLRVGVLLAALLALLFAVVVFLIFRTGKEKDKTNRQLAEKNALIEQQSKDKDMLMREIHHRVKNNLQIVSSLLNLQANTVTDAAAKEALRDSHNRIKSIALIHQKLYMQQEFTAILLQDYIQQLCQHLKSALNASAVQIQCSIRPPQLTLDIETSIPLGVIINELVTNSIKYAQINHAGGLIKIQISSDNTGLCTLHYADNGIGMPEGFDVKKSPTLGLRMVYELTRQLRGAMVYAKIPEPEFTIAFPVKQ